MTADEAVEYIANELRINDADTRIALWIRISLDEIGTEYNFKDLKKFSDVNTVAGNPDVTLESDFHRLFDIQIPVDNRALFPKDQELISDENPDYRTRQGQIQYYYFHGVNIMGLWLVPDSIKNITYCYQARPNSITDLPVEWHRYACQRAITAGHRADSNFEGVRISEMTEAKLKRRIGVNAFKRPDERMVMGQSSRYSGRPGKPKLPSNYPRGS